MKIITLDEKTLELIPLRGKMSSTFEENVRQLQRPYIPISQEVYDQVFADGANYFKLEDSVVTFGNADGGFALMPLQWKYAKKILEKN